MWHSSPQPPSCRMAGMCCHPWLDLPSVFLLCPLPSTCPHHSRESFQNPQEAVTSPHILVSLHTWSRQRQDGALAPHRRQGLNPLSSVYLISFYKFNFYFFTIHFMSCLLPPSWSPPHTHNPSPLPFSSEGVGDPPLYPPQTYTSSL